MPVRRLRSRWVGRAILSLLLACGWLATLWQPSGAAGTTLMVGQAVAINATDGICSLLEAFEVVRQLENGNTSYTDTDCWPSGSSSLS